MFDRPITGKDAAIYIDSVSRHGLHADTRWLIDVGRFPVGGRVLDVGCGTGALVAALAADRQYARSIIGIEMSPELAAHARGAIDSDSDIVTHADFQTWTPPGDWRPDVVVMSYFLHHSADYGVHLRRAAALLPHGGRLYVIDRMAIDSSALDTFPKFWDEKYKLDHEWSEEMPRLVTFGALKEAAADAGFDFVRRLVCPHDNRSGAEGFPKTLMEFWRHEPGHVFPAILVVSPAHIALFSDIVAQLGLQGLQVSESHSVSYSSDLIRTIYERCPWCELLLQFVAKVCPKPKAVALMLDGDDTTPKLLHRLSEFKKTHRDRWPNINGPTTADGIRAIILPFHVAEPYESEALASVVRLSTTGA